MTLTPGDRLGPYQVTGKIGAGGMGEVYQAHDRALEREVALKVLPAAVTADPDLLARFEREAKLLAQLNHPNIAHVYGLETSGATRALVMELVDGPTLAERLESGALPVAEALSIARQIAEALEAAHEKGIVHRDLKPQNVKLAVDGRVKVLDFGLAKAMDPRSTRSGAVSQLAASPTLTLGATVQGMILGTAAYMAPEQAKGLAVDKRADIWAFGVVLFEMLSARSPFAGESVAETLAAVLKSEIDYRQLPAETPPAVQRLLHRCLARDLRNRLHDIADARIVIDEVLSGRGSEIATVAPPAAPAWQRLAPWALAGLLAAALGWALLARPGAPTGAPASRTSVLSMRLPPGLELPLDERGIYGQTAIVAIAPDGSRVVFIAGPLEQARLHTRELSSDEVVPIEGTEGASSPFFSPDGRWVGFFGAGKLRKVLVAGGRPIDLADASLDRGAVWCPDGSIVFTPGVASGLARLPATGGQPQALTTLDFERGERTHRWPALLPNGREVAFTIGLVGKPGDYENSGIDVVDLATGKRRPFLRGASMVRFTASGHVLVGREGQVLAQPLGAREGGGTEGARPVLRSVAGIPSSGIVHFDVSSNGTLVYAQGDPQSDERHLAWLGRDGKLENLPLPPRPYFWPTIAPDGRRLAVNIGAGGGRSSDVWVHDLAGGGGLTRVTFDNKSFASIWSRDSRRLTYGRIPPTGGDVISERLADGTADALDLFAFERGLTRAPVAWMPDDSLLWWEDAGAGTAGNLVYAARSESTSRPFASTPALEMLGTTSTDGRYVAYVSDTAGEPVIHVQPFPPTGAKWQVAANATAPRFSRDGRELVFWQGGMLMALPISTHGTFSFGTARRLVEVPPSVSLVSDKYANYDVAPDGRFLVVRSASERFSSSYLTVALDWFEELRRLVPLQAR